MHADIRTPQALRDGSLCSHQLGTAWSVHALLRSWALGEPDLRQASLLTAEVAATADRSGRGLMSLSLTPHERSLRVTADEHDVDEPDVSVHVTAHPEGRTTFVVARQRATEDVPDPDSVVWFSLTVADGTEDALD